MSNLPRRPEQVLGQANCDVFNLTFKAKRYVISQINRSTAVFADVERFVQRDANRNRAFYQFHLGMCSVMVGDVLFQAEVEVVATCV